MRREVTGLITKVSIVSVWASKTYLSAPSEALPCLVAEVDCGWKLMVEVDCPESLRRQSHSLSYLSLPSPMILSREGPSVRLWAFRNRCPGLRLETAWWEGDAELLVLLFRKKRTSIRARSSLFATSPPGACPAESLSYLCVAGPPRTGELRPHYGLYRTERRA
jgi:hypothetical protein